MKKVRMFVRILSLSFASVFMLGSCVMENDVMSTTTGGKGSLSLSLKVSADFDGTDSKATKALNEKDYKDESNYTIQVFDSNGKQVGEDYTYDYISKNDLTLDAGDYTVTAFYGKEHDASRDEFYVVGSGEFTVNGSADGESKKTTSKSLTCEPTCGKVVTNFDASMATYFENYKVEYSTAALNGGTVEWSETDTEPWYLKVPSKGETIKATITLTPKSEFALSETATLERTYELYPNKSWTLNIKPSYTGVNPTLGISITFNDETDDKDVDIIVPSDWLLD